MVQQIIGIGTSANDGTGDPLRTAFNKVNANFAEIYGKDAIGANFDFTENTLSSTNTNGNIELDPNGTGLVVIQDDRMLIASSFTPSSAVGLSSDRPGMIAWDSNYVYVCVAHYDGSTHIWKRTALASW